MHISTPDGACTALQVLPPGGQLVSVEQDLQWWLVAKRFMWQASQGQKNTSQEVPLGDKVRLLKVGGWVGEGVNATRTQ